MSVHQNVVAYIDLGGQFPMVAGFPDRAALDEWLREFTAIGGQVASAAIFQRPPTCIPEAV